jgi:hypothetical protein
MIEFSRFFRQGRKSYLFFIRGWKPYRTWWQIYWFARRLWLGRWEGGSWGELSLRHLPLNSYRCYCPTGSTTEFRIALWGWGCWIYLGRDWTAKPCLCDRVSWAVFPDLHEDEIEEYGAEKLLAEFPDLCDSSLFSKKSKNPLQ